MRIRPRRCREKIGRRICGRDAGRSRHLRRALASWPAGFLERKRSWRSRRPDRGIARFRHLGLGDRNQVAVGEAWATQSYTLVDNCLILGIDPSILHRRGKSRA
jgi:hypothetical protein